MGLKLMAEVGLDGAGFERGLHKMGEEAAHSVKALAVEAFGIYGIEQAIAKTVETATDLVNTSKRLDVTVEQLQLLRQAAKDGGTEMGALTGAFEKLDIARAKALAGGKEGDKAREAFAKIGITDSELRGQTAASLFMNKIRDFAKSNNAEDVGPVLRDILGKGFGEVIPVLKTDFDELSAKMHKLGSIMDADTAVKLKAVGDNFELLKNILAVQLAPALLAVVEMLLEIVGKIKSYASFFGAATSNMSASDWVKLIAAPYLPNNSDAKAGAEAFDESEKQWKDQVEELRKKLKEEADELKNPKPLNPYVDDVEFIPKDKKAHISKQTDALVKVGNFLGSTGNTISRVDQRKISLMEQQLKATIDVSTKIGRLGIGGFMGGIPTV